MIQTWTITFRGQSDMQGVVQVYNELKSKGIEFPMTDLESTAPIHTPQRSVTSQPQLPQPQVQSLPAIQNSSHVQRHIMGPVNLSPEQLAKLKHELDLVQGNMKVFNEMLNELTPGQEHDDDYELLNELNNTCQSMQQRIVELIEKVANEEVTNELLRVNDELNNLFLRFERHSKKRLPKTNNVTSQPNQPRQPGEESLIDFTEESAASSMSNKLAAIHLSGINAASGGKSQEASAGDDFDEFAQSRLTSDETADGARQAKKQTQGNLQVIIYLLL